MAHPLTGNLLRGLLFVISAPAGTGKTTLVNCLLKRTQLVVRSVSYTTRAPRRGEEDGVDYHFISTQGFLSKVAAGEFLEHVELYGDYYGSSRLWIEKQRAAGRHVVLVIDTQGALALSKEVLDAIYIFVSPPSLACLEERLRGRKSESSEALKARLAWAEREFATIPHYDYLIINDDLSVACDALYSIVIAEEHRTSRLLHLKIMPDVPYIHNNPLPIKGSYDAKTAAL